MAEKEFALYKGEEIIAEGTIQEIADQLQVKVETVKFYNTPAYKKRVARRRAAKGAKYKFTEKTLVCTNKETGEYDLYINHKFVTHGTLQAIAEELGITVEGVKFWRTPSYKKRVQEWHSRIGDRAASNAVELVCLDDDDDYYYEDEEF